jgi:hypothetical protein
VIDPLDAVLHVLQQAGRPLTAGQVKQALQADGLTAADADAAWRRSQKRLSAHEHIVVDHEHRYEWSAQPLVPDPERALDRLAQGGLTAAQRSRLAAVVRDGLGGGTEPHATIPMVRALAELAIEVEELTVNQASSRAMIHRVRAQVQRVGLEPIDAAGEQSTLDRARHEPVGRPIEDGAPVIVVRPGYVWKAPTGDVLIARAVVRDGSS